MDALAVLQQVGPPITSGITAFAGAFFRFKQRLQKAEKNAKAALAAIQNLEEAHATTERTWAGAFAEQQRKLDKLREDIETEQRHRTELNEAIENERASRPDPLEEIRETVQKLHDQFEKMKERQGRFVRNETFIAHTKEQETQWRAVEKTLGRLEVLANAVGR